MNTPSFADVIQKTKQLLNTDDADFSYITPELVEQDSKAADVTFLDDSADLTTYVGNNARYGAWTDGNGTTWQGYYFNYGPNDPCGSSHTWFVSVDWHHTYLGRCPNGREKWRFSR